MVNRRAPDAFTRSNLFWFLLVLVFSLPALSPLLTTTPTRSADGLLHLYRLVQIDAMWQQGVWFARWFPDVAYGYGMPLFNYYAPLAYYLTAPLHLLGIPFSLALNLALAGALLCGAVSMFFFARALAQSIDRARFEHTAAYAALVAALAFLYAPYILFNALQRANLAEQWALAFAPLALWRILELARAPGTRNWFFVVSAFAAVLLSHNVTGLLFAPLLFGFALTAMLAFPSPAQNTAQHARAFGIIFSALLCALTLSAFFWLPALMEREYAQIARVIVTPDFDYRFNFVAPAELFTLLPRAGTARLNPAYPNTLGLAQIILAVTGLLVITLRFRARRALPIFFLAFAALAFTLLMLAISQPVWDSTTLLSFVQLPMRMRGLVALCLAPLSGFFIFAFASRWRAVASSAALVVLVLSALPLLYPRYARNVPLNPTITDMFAYEKQSGAFGTTSFGEYLPAWVRELPDKSPFADAYANRALPDRFVLPEGVTVCGSEIRFNAQELCINANDAWYAVYRAFYFPGWRAFLDDRALDLTPTPRTGLISMRVPGSGTLRVAYAGTDTQHLAEWISLASALLVLGVTLFAAVKFFRARTVSQNTTARDDAAYPNLRDAALFCLVAFALIAFKALYVDHFDNAWVTRSNSAQVQDISHPQRAQFNHALELLGYDIDRSAARAGDTVRVTMYWRALPNMKKNLSTFVHLVARDGTIVTQQDSLHPANVPTTQWDADAYGADIHALVLPDALAPGQYELRGGVYDAATNARLQIADGADAIVLGTIEVK